MVTFDFALLRINAHALQVWSHSLPDTILAARKFADLGMIAIEGERIRSELRCITINDILMLLSRRFIYESARILPYW